MKTNVGEIIKLNEKEYVVTNKLECNSITYVMLMSTTKPITIELCREIIEDEKLKMIFISNTEEKKYILDLITNSQK